VRRRRRRVTPPVGRYQVRARIIDSGIYYIGDGSITANVLDGQRLSIRVDGPELRPGRYVDVQLDFRRVRA
jgi:hypothetical protein